MTVCVLDPERVVETPASLRAPEHFRVDYFSGSGAGGQHRNRHLNSVRLVHLPTGIVETRQGREKAKNLLEARRAMDERLDREIEAVRALALSHDKREQAGSGMRGDKAFTLRFQDDRLSVHRDGRVVSLSRFMRGEMSEALEGA